VRKRAKDFCYIADGGSLRKHKARKLFFFEKKNQKTFVFFGRHRISLFGPGAAGGLEKEQLYSWR
jgi:hypothetical protein